MILGSNRTRVVKPVVLGHPSFVPEVDGRFPPDTMEVTVEGQGMSFP